MSRTAATALAVLLTAACTGGDHAPPLLDTVLDTVDLDAAVGTDVVVHDLAPSPDGLPVALVGAAGAAESWLVPLAGGTPTAVPAVDPDSELVIADDGTPLVVGTALTRVGGAVLPLPLDGPPDAVLLDGDVLSLARDTRLAAVDVGTGEVRATAVAPGPVTHLARTPDGDLVALVTRPGGGVDLVRLTPDLLPDGEPVELVARGGTPTALRVTADGTVVATAYVNEALDAGRLVTVVDGRVRTVVDLEGTDDTALDLAVIGGMAYVVLSATYHPAELTAIDLATGERTGTVALCGGAGAFGAMASSADGGALTVVGSCIDADGPSTTAFVIG
jgi:dipeptidyl aminopeptidase/acylaminoacyl peptidase